VATLRRAGARRVVVATYLLAPGFFADRIAASARAAGAAAVSAALGAAPEVAELVLRRYEQALARPAAATAPTQAAARA
jgi:sirohydrochlorin ferrochelatase